MCCVYLQWLDECIKLHQQQQQQQHANNGSSAEDHSSHSSSRQGLAAQQLLAPVVGAGIEAERTRAAQGVADKDVAGARGWLLAANAGVDVSYMACEFSHAVPSTQQVVIVSQAGCHDQRSCAARC